MSELNERDMEVLGDYVRDGNRERYWDYLAQHERSDGSGLQALGVVRNDNMPGAVAHAYAQSYASPNNGVSMSDSDVAEVGFRPPTEPVASQPKT